MYLESRNLETVLRDLSLRREPADTAFKPEMVTQGECMHALVADGSVTEEEGRALFKDASVFEYRMREYVIVL